MLYFNYYHKSHDLQDGHPYKKDYVHTSIILDWYSTVQYSTVQYSTYSTEPVTAIL
jgi:hypothetical protein